MVELTKDKPALTPKSIVLIADKRRVEDAKKIGEEINNPIYKIKFEDGSAGALKVHSKVNTEGDVTAWRIGQTLGWDILPETIEMPLPPEIERDLKKAGRRRIPKTVSVQRWVPGEEVTNHLRLATRYDPARYRPKSLSQQRDLARIYYFDRIYGNPDRHGDNIFVNQKTGDLYAIDNWLFHAYSLDMKRVHPGKASFYSTGLEFKRKREEGRFAYFFSSPFYSIPRNVRDDVLREIEEKQHLIIQEIDRSKLSMTDKAKIKSNLKKFIQNREVFLSEFTPEELEEGPKPKRLRVMESRLQSKNPSLSVATPRVRREVRVKKYRRERLGFFERVRRHWRRRPRRRR